MCVSCGLKRVVINSSVHKLQHYLPNILIDMVGVDLHDDSKGHVCTRNNMLLIQMVKWYAKYSAKEFICIVFNQFNMSVNWPLICAFNIYCILLIYLSSYFYMQIQILNSSSVISHQSNSCHLLKRDLIGYTHVPWSICRR